MTIDTASIISHLDEDAQKELKEYFDANGSVPESVLNNYRKRKKMESAEEENANEIPDSDSLTTNTEEQPQNQWRTEETASDVQGDDITPKTVSENILDSSETETFPNADDEKSESHVQGVQIPADFNPSDYAPSLL